MEFYGISASIADTKAELEGWLKAQPPLLRCPTDTGDKGVIYREPNGAYLTIEPLNAPSR